MQLHLLPDSCDRFPGAVMDTDSVPDEWRIPDALWAEIEMHLPRHVNTHRFGGGRPRGPDRVCMEAILFVLRTGCQWKALDATGICPGSTAHDRFQEWVQAGVFLTRRVGTPRRPINSPQADAQAVEPLQAEILPAENAAR